MKKMMKNTSLSGLEVRAQIIIFGDALFSHCAFSSHWNGRLWRPPCANVIKNIWNSLNSLSGSTESILLVRWNSSTKAIWCAQKSLKDTPNRTLLNACRGMIYAWWVCDKSFLTLFGIAIKHHFLLDKCSRNTSNTIVLSHNRIEGLCVSVWDQIPGYLIQLHFKRFESINCIIRSAIGITQVRDNVRSVFSLQNGTIFKFTSKVKKFPMELYAKSGCGLTENLAYLQFKIYLIKRLGNSVIRHWLKSLARKFTAVTIFALSLLSPFLSVDGWSIYLLVLNEIRCLVHFSTHTEKRQIYYLTK